ncbi:MAG: translocase [Myxococcota bacterium]|nr:translocase [Myxococcota bacterium]MDW8361940.1 translocase [Myxococcales bacterium]
MTPPRGDEGAAPLPPSTAPASATSRAAARALRVFGHVEPHELPLLGALAASGWLALAGHYALKTAREPLVQATGGMIAKGWATALQALLLAALVPLYAWLCRRLDRARLVAAALAASATALVGFATLLPTAAPWVGVAFYVFSGIHGLLAVALVWSVASELLTTAQGHRLLPLVALGAGCGALCGSWLAAHRFEGGAGIPALLALSALFVVGQLLLGLWLLRRCAARSRSPARRLVAPETTIGFGLLRHSATVRWLATAVLLLNVVNTTGELVLAQMAGAAADQSYAALAASQPGLDRTAHVRAFLGGFYAQTHFAVNAVTLLLQAFVASRLLQRAGVGRVLGWLPLVSVGTWSLAALGLGLYAVRAAKVLENATDYSLGTSARAAVLLPTGAAERWSGRQQVDTFFVRAGDLLAAGLVLVAVQAGGWGARELAAVNVLLAVTALGVLHALGREHERRVRTERSAPAALPAAVDALRSAATSHH